MLTRCEYIPVRSARAIRPPWMAEVPGLQEQNPAMARDGQLPPSLPHPTQCQLQVRNHQSQIIETFHTPTVWCGGVAEATGRCLRLLGATCGVPSSPHQQDGVADPGNDHCTSSRGRRGRGLADRRAPWMARAEPTWTYLRRVGKSSAAPPEVHTAMYYLNTTVLLPFTMMRCSQCHFTARANAAHSASRPIWTSSSISKL